VASGNSCHDFRPSASSRFPFCQAAEQKNAENLLVIQDPALASKYTVNSPAENRTILNKDTVLSWQGVPEQL
jgi:hypothetical protein